MSMSIRRQRLGHFHGPFPRQAEAALKAGRTKVAHETASRVWKTLHFQHIPFPTTTSLSKMLSSGMDDLPHLAVRRIPHHIRYGPVLSRGDSELAIVHMPPGVPFTL